MGNQGKHAAKYKGKNKFSYVCELKTCDTGKKILLSRFLGMWLC